MKNRYRKYISVYVRNADGDPASYYRIIQYIKNLNLDTVKVNNALNNYEYNKNLNFRNNYIKKLYQAYLFAKIVIRRMIAMIYDLIYAPKCIIISREMFPRYIPGFLLNLEKKLVKKKNTIWDFDDDLYAFGEIAEKEGALLESLSKNIIVTHEYLASLISEKYRAKVTIMPTTDSGCKDIIKYKKSIQYREKVLENDINIVWIGTSNNLQNLDIAMKGIEMAADYIMLNFSKNVVMHIVCNEPYKRKNGSSELIIRNYRWSREKALDIMLTAHIGIMPLKKTAVSEGKGAFKLIQYLANGIPVIASPEGYNVRVVDSKFGILANSEEEWKEAVIETIFDIGGWKRKSYEARMCYEKQFNYKTNLIEWKRIINNLCKDKRE